MEEEKLAAETSAEETSGADGEVAAPRDDQGEPFTDSPDAGEKETEPAEPSKDPDVQPKEERSYQARLRRERERKEAERLAYERGKAEALIGLKNPFTGEVVRDVVDAEELRVMQEIELMGGDPITDFSGYQKKKLRAREAETAKQREADAFFETDAKEFEKAHPDLDLDALISDNRFARFAGGRIGKESLKVIYDDFLTFTGELETRAAEKAHSLMAKAAASPGSLGGGDTPSPSYASMSDAEFERKLSAVLKGRETV